MEDATRAKALKLECACDSPNLGGGGKLFCNIVYTLEPIVGLEPGPARGWGKRDA